MTARTGVAIAAAVAMVSWTDAPAPARAAEASDPLTRQTVAGTSFLVRAGFLVERVTPADRTAGYLALTFDSRGRLVVSAANGSPCALLDANGDVIREATAVVAPRVRNCQAMRFDGPTLYGICDQPVPHPAAFGRPGGHGRPPRTGLFEMLDTNGDGAADTVQMRAAVRPDAHDASALTPHLSPAAEADAAARLNQVAGLTDGSRTRLTSALTAGARSIDRYASYAYPREYFGALVLADRSGRDIRAIVPQPTGDAAMYVTSRVLVHGARADITDLEVGPDGLVYFSTGPRGARGGIWRLRYTGGAAPSPDMTGLHAIVHQRQPLSSWGWEAIDHARTAMGAAFGPALERLARDESADAADRARALYELQRHGPAPAAALLDEALADEAAAVRVAARNLVGGRRAAVAAAGRGTKATISVLSFRLRPGARQTMMSGIGFDSMSPRALTNVLAAPQGSPSSGQ
jgi:hypothetical protein